MKKRDTNTGRNITPGFLPKDSCYYYLHTNGEIIHKNRHYDWRGFEESDFVKQWWILDLTNRADCYNMLFRAMMLGADAGRVIFLKQHWHIDDEDTKEYCKRVLLPWKYDGEKNMYVVHDTVSNYSLFNAVAEFYRKAVEDNGFFQSITQKPGHEKVDVNSA